MSALSQLARLFGFKGDQGTAPHLPGLDPSPSSERGYRTTPENAIKHICRGWWPDPDLRQTTLDVREMDRTDGRAKKIHTRTARLITGPGLHIRTSSDNTDLIDAFSRFTDITGLDNNEKLESDARALLIEGNLALQWVLNGDGRVARCIRMASETFMPIVGPNGQFLDPAKAWIQYDIATGRELAAFALYELTMARLTPDNYDDWGSRGRPYLDATRIPLRQLRMEEDDLVIRRRTRAPLRMAHVLEGATAEQLEDYRQQVERDQDQITTDFYLNRKGGVSALQGDAALDQIADVTHLLDTFFAGCPAPKGLFGYAEGLNRDILEDMKKDYYEEIDALQDIIADAYERGFELDLLLQGINPEDYEFEVCFAERRTDTPNQRADLALKYQAMGVPPELVWDAAGLDPAAVRAEREAAANRNDPYPDPTMPGGAPGPRVAITPGNRPKGESATSISNA